MRRSALPRIGRRTLLSVFVATALLIAMGYAAIGVSYLRSDVSSDDFIAFYTAATMVRDGNASRLYDAQLQRDTQRRVLSSTSESGAGSLSDNRQLQAYFNPPVYAAALAPLAFLRLTSAYRVMLAIESMLLVLSLVIAWRLVASRALVTRGLFTLGVLGSPITSKAIFQAQASMLVLLAVLTSLLLAPRRPLMSGLVLSVIVVKPQLAPVFALVLVAAGQWPILKGFIAGTIGLSLASLAIVGPDGLYDEARLLLHASNGPEQFGIDAAIQQNWKGFAYSFAGTYAGPVSVVGWGIILVAVMALVWSLRREREMTVLYGATTLLALLASPHLHFHDLVLLVVPGAAALAVGGQRPPMSWTILAGWYFLLLIAFALWQHGVSVTVWPLAATALLFVLWARQSLEGVYPFPRLRASWSARPVRLVERSP